VDHSEYIKLIEAVEALPRVKKVFIRSGIRFDYLMYDPDDSFFRKLVRDNISGQLKVAPEHCSDEVLLCMGKPKYSVYSAFRKKFFELTREIGKEQYLIPYLMSSHPGSTLSCALDLACQLKKEGYSPEQVQDYYPTPGTVSTVMFYTHINPLTGKKVYVADDYSEKQMQRALLQFSRPQNADLVRKAIRKCGREDLIGYGEGCLIRPESGKTQGRNTPPTAQKKDGRHTGGERSHAYKGREDGRKVSTKNSSHGKNTKPTGRNTKKK